MATHSAVVLVVAALCAPLVMLCAVAAERRLGPSAAGWLAALPVSMPAAVAAICLDGGRHAASQLAASAAAHVGAQVLFAVMFSAVLLRRGLVLGIVAGVGTYAGVSLMLYRVPVTVLIALAMIALLAAPRLMHQDTPRRPRPAGAVTIAVTCLLSSVVVAIAVVVSHAAGPTVGGSVAAFPLVSMTLAATIAMREGPSAGAHALLGLVRSLPCYLAFCVTAALTTPALGVAALAVAVPVSLLAGALTWRTVPVVQTPAVSTVDSLGGDRSTAGRTGAKV